MCINKISSISPVLKTNNRNVNQEFFEKVLGMKTLLEDGALLSLGDQSKTDRLYLEESPSMRTRKVEGPKRLACLKIRVTNPQEIEWLLARGHQVDRLFRGENGYAFEALSPEGDRILLHAEEQVDSLTEIEEVPDFQANEEFTTLTEFFVEKIVLRVPNVETSTAFYQQLPGLEEYLDLEASDGPDLTLANGQTWDLCQVKVILEPFVASEVASCFGDQVTFVPKRQQFVLVADPSKIEWWFEA